MVVNNKNTQFEVAFTTTWLYVHLCLTSKTYVQNTLLNYDKICLGNSAIYSRHLTFEITRPLTLAVPVLES